MNTTVVFANFNDVAMFYANKRGIFGRTWGYKLNWI